jgi:subfamily B ATP-binding cassette protein MsbA
MSEGSGETGEFTNWELLRGLLDVAKFNPKLSAIILGLGLCTAVLEGIGLTFILPIIEVVQVEDPTTEAEGIMLAFILLYETLGIPFMLETVIVGVTLVLGLRFGTLFVLKWLRELLKVTYMRDLRRRGFGNALEAETAYYDEKGSDEVINAIITQTQYAGRVINKIIILIEKGFLALVFGVVAFILSPLLTGVALVIFVVLTVLVQTLTEKGTDVGNRVADANERIQQTVQTGTQGIRDVKTFGMVQEFYADFSSAIDDFVSSRVAVKRNKAAVSSLYQFSAAATLFVLIYLGITFGNLTLGALGVFLFAMFRLGPIVSKLNSEAYQVLTDLPHLIRTQRFVDELQDETEPDVGDRALPNRIEDIRFEDVSFSYNDDEQVLDGISFQMDSGDFVAFVGQSGAGKSTIASLLARLYEPDSGQIMVNGTNLSRFDIDEWRDKVAIVRQNPFIFNDTLRYNLTIGNRDATQRDINRACEVAMVTEFLDDLPEGYDSILGDDGVQLSGGQKQRVAIARALIKKDAELLILDEATSDLDTNLEDRIQSALEEAAREFTTLAIAHRLSTVRNADRIYTLEDGQITETGRHKELLDEGGKYSELYRSQVTTD